MSAAKKKVPAKVKKTKVSKPSAIPTEPAEWADDVTAIVVIIKGAQRRMRAVYARVKVGRKTEDIFLASSMRLDTLHYFLNALEETYGVPVIEEEDKAS